MIAHIKALLKKLAKLLRELSREEENQCRHCGVCHHVCQLVKNKNSFKAREE